MDKKLKARPAHLAEFINYTMSMYKECDGLRLAPEDIKPAAGEIVNWKVEYVHEKDISDKAAETLSRVVDMHAGIIEVVWDG